MNAPQPPTDRRELDPAGRAASDVLALVVQRNPEFRVTPEVYRATRAVMESLVSALVAGGAR